MKQEARERILKSAKIEFSEKGFDGARMGAIARKADVNQAMIHYYFNSKENLYEQVLLRVFGLEQKNRIINFFKDRNLNPPESLYLGIYFLVHLYMKPMDPLFERFLRSQIGSGGIKRLIAIVKKFFIPQFNFLEKAISRGVASGDFESHDIVFTVMQIVLYVVNYENFRYLFSDTDLYGHIYGRDYKKRVFEFLVTLTFKGLCPSDKKPVIPAIPDDLIGKVNEMIESIILETQGGVND